MLHNICMSAVAMSGERTVARGPLVFWCVFLFCLLFFVVGFFFFFFFFFLFIFCCFFLCTYFNRPGHTCKESQ